MSQQLRWFRPDSPVARDVIEITAMHLGVQFPSDFIECAMNNHGGSPLPNVFDMADLSEVFGELLSFEEGNPLNLVNTYGRVQDRFLPGIIPLASDPFGNLICFDYRNGKVPVIVFWDHEKAFLDPAKALTPICDSFGELLSMLREEE